MLEKLRYYPARDSMIPSEILKRCIQAVKQLVFCHIVDFMLWLSKFCPIVLNLIADNESKKKNNYPL